VEAAKKKVLAFGASTTQGYGATKGHDYVSDLIGLVGGKYDIINAGLAGNEILSSAVGLQGDKRFTGWLAGMKAAIIWEGNDDIAAGAKAGPIESGYRQMLEKAHADNMKVVGATLQPSNFPAGEEKQRLAVNQWIRSSGAFDAVADFAAVLRDPKNYDHMASWVYNKGQVHGVHPGDAGYAAIAPVAASALNKVLATSVAKTAKTTAKTLSLESEATLKNHYKEYAAGNKNAMSPFEKHLWHLLHIGDSWSQIESMYGGKPKSSSSSGSTNLDYVFNPGTGNFADAENGALIQEMFRAGGGSIVGVNSGTYDNGGWLQPGYTMAYNGTGQPEQVMGPNSGGGPMTLEVVSGGQSAFEQFMLQAIRNWVRVKGGGDVQRAFGSK
jgi:lysophospholipase L1-like esterase